VVHRSVWTKSTKWLGAPEDGNIRHVIAKLEGFDAAIFGDNHKGFIKDGKYLNCGTFQRRHSTEKDYEPRIGLLKKEGGITRIRLDCVREESDAEDKFVDSCISSVESKEFDFSKVLSKLNNLGESGVDFIQSLLQALEANPKLSQGVRDILHLLIDQRD
jgi:hypothetical protein